MTPSDLTPVTLMFEMRERLVRIETKMDASTEKVADHDDRIALLETNATQLQSQIGMLKWIGGGFVTIVTLFGDKLLSLF